MTEVFAHGAAAGGSPGRLPIKRACPFDPPAELMTLQAASPVTPLAFPDGRDGWLITGFDAGRAALANSALGASGSHSASPVGPDRPYQEAPPAPPGMFILMDAPEHTRYRQLLARYFTSGRVQALKPRIRQIIDDQLDAIADSGRTGAPVDLVREFTLPIPSLVICELLGVPYADLLEFQAKSASFLTLNGLEETASDRQASAVEQARDDICGYIYSLVLAKRAAPANDLISTLIEAVPGDEPLNDTELVSIATLLLVAGHETTASMLSLGALALLVNPGQRAWLGQETPLAVEELLRYLTVFHLGLSRIATADVTIGGQVIRRGDPVLVSLSAANRDVTRFTDPDALRIDRPAAANLAFGYGVHACIGAPLARLEIGLALEGLFARFPGLCLTEPAEKLVYRERSVVYGVAELPVTW
jgi:cytochrome P450